MMKEIERDRADILDILKFAAAAMKKPTRIEIPFYKTYDLDEEVRDLDPITAHMIVQHAREVLNR